MASNGTFGRDRCRVFEQIDPLRVGETNRLMNVAKEYDSTSGAEI